VTTHTVKFTCTCRPFAPQEVAIKGLWAGHGTPKWFIPDRDAILSCPFCHGKWQVESPCVLSPWPPSICVRSAQLRGMDQYYILKPAWSERKGTYDVEF